MSGFTAKMILDFFVAFGVVLGGCLLGGMGAVVTLQSPSEKMMLIAENIKIWAMVVAVGGSIDPLRFIESSVMEGHLSPAIKQILLIVSSFIGAHIGVEMIRLICKGGGTS